MRALGEAFPAGERVQGVAACHTCGATFEVDSGENTLELSRRYWQKVLDGEVPGFCEECTARAEEDLEDAERERTELRDARLRAAQIPKAFQVTFSDVDGKSDPVVVAARQWSVEGGGLVLLGDVGRGKTFLAGAAARARAWHGPIRWLSTPALLAGLRAGYGTDEQRFAAQALTPVRDLALVLDDLDKARPTDTSLETLFLAVDRWCAQGYPLLVTTNWDLDKVRDEWPGSYGPAIASRLAGYCRVVHVKGPDRRVT